jgi:hypothetical protein
MRMKWWNTGEDMLLKCNIQKYKETRVVAEGPWNAVEDADSMWNEMSTHIWEVAIEMFEVTRGDKHKPKET